MSILENCLLNDYPEDMYHADPCPEPSLSSTMANTIIEKTEVEAMMGSQRLNPKYVSKTSDVMSLGNIAHAMLLSNDESVYEIAPVDAWRTNEAKEMKADIERRNKIALNTKTSSIIVDVRAMIESLHKQLSVHKEYPDLFKKGRGEVSGFCKDEILNIWLRARFDWLPEDYEDLIVDYKTTGLDFDQWEKNELWKGKYIQNPHYRKVYDTITGKKSKFIWVVQQTKAPFLIKIYEIDDGYNETVDMRYNHSSKVFQKCIKSGEWGGTLPYAIHSFPPPWVMDKWTSDEMNMVNVSAIEDENKSQDPTETRMAG